MQAIVRIKDVERNQTRHGNTRYTVRDDTGHEYVTFRPPVGEQAERFKSRPAKIEFHEEVRGDFKNVYLDAVEPADDEELPAYHPHDNADAVAWQTAAEAAPLIVGSDPHYSGEELFEALKPFKDRVAQDIRGETEPEDDGANGDDEPPANVTPLHQPTKRSR